MLSWFIPDERRKALREDRKYLVGRARRFLLSYLASDNHQKQRYLELISGADAACQPETSDPKLQNTQVSQVVANTAFRVVKKRQRQTENGDQLPRLITDAYATVAIAYRRAAAVYVLDEEMQQLGTAAVHMITIANSYLAAQSSEAPVIEEDASGDLPATNEARASEASRICSVERT